MPFLVAEHFIYDRSPLAEDSAVSAGADGDAAMPRVLLIEDDRETATEVKAELVERGYEVEWAATGIEGLDKASGE